MDKQTFSLKVIQSEQTLYRISKSMLKNDTYCEDVVSVTILKAYEKLGTLKDESFFKTWLVKILINECYSFLRHQNSTVDLENCSELTAPENQDYSDLYMAISVLTPPIRLVIMLHYIEGYAIDEVGKILKIPVGTVKSRLFNGRKLLKEYLSVEENL